MLIPEYPYSFTGRMWKQFYNSLWSFRPNSVHSYRLELCRKMYVYSLLCLFTFEAGSWNVQFSIVQKMCEIWANSQYIFVLWKAVRKFIPNDRALIWRNGVIGSTQLNPYMKDYTYYSASFLWDPEADSLFKEKYPIAADRNHIKEGRKIRNAICSKMSIKVNRGILEIWQECSVNRYNFF